MQTCEYIDSYLEEMLSPSKHHTMTGLMVQIWKNSGSINKVVSQLGEF